MNVNDTQYNFIRTSLSFNGISDVNLLDDLLDHICSYIEKDDSANFEEAFSKAIAALGGYGALQLMQHKITETALIRGLLVRQKIFYMVSSFNLMLLASGFLFKLNKWPFSTVLLASGFGILIFFTIPFWFYKRHKYQFQKIIQVSKQNSI